MVDVAQLLLASVAAGRPGDRAGRRLRPYRCRAHPGRRDPDGGHRERPPGRRTPRLGEHAGPRRQPDGDPGPNGDPDTGVDVAGGESDPAEAASAEDQPGHDSEPLNEPDPKRG